MNTENGGYIAVSGFLWRLAERFGAKLVSFAVSIILARLLLPEEYGTVALATMFISIFQVFVDSGLASALIQKKDSDELDFSSVFYFNCGMCIVLYIIVFLAAPYVARFYQNQQLISLIRFSAISLLISGLKNVQQAYIFKYMLFKRFFFSTIGGTVFSALIGITMAYMGLGAWALVMQQISNICIDTLIIWLTVDWRPKWCFSLKRLRKLLMYGIRMLLAGVLDTVYSNLRSLTIGKLYSEADLAYFNKAKGFPDIIVSNINTSINSVLLPVISGAQDDKKKCKELTRKSIKLTSYILAPFMIGMMIIARPMVSLLLTDKWLPCVPFLRIFCVTSFFIPITTANLNLIASLGKMDIYLKLAFWEKFIGVSALILSARHGVTNIAVSLLITSPIIAICNALPNKKLVGYSISEEIKDIAPSVILSSIMAVLVYPISLLKLPLIAIIFFQISSGVIIYILLSYVFKVSMFFFVLEYFINLRRSRSTIKKGEKDE